MSSAPVPRDVLGLVVPSWGSVVAAEGVGWHVVGDDGEAVEEIQAFLIDVAATGASVPTRRSYAYDMLRWWRFCAAVGVPWQQALRYEVRDFVLWLQSATNDQRRRTVEPAPFSSVTGQGAGDRGSSRPAAGSVNAVTGKSYLAAGYAPRTINHALTVISSFYEFALESGLGPLVNPVPRSAPGRMGPQHRTSGGSSGLRRRGTYRQRQPLIQPRSIGEPLLQELFAVLGNDRDRALVAVTLSSGVRASELLSMIRSGVNAGEGVLSVVGKGQAGMRVWVPAAPESFVWIARYLAGRPSPAGGPGWGEHPLWMTLSEPPRPLTYFTLRQVLERANSKLGTNLTWHDFRHTFAHRLLSDERMALTDVQMLLRHRNLDTLQAYSAARLDELVASLHRHLARPAPPEDRPAPGYAASDLNTLFPGVRL